MAVHAVLDEVLHRCARRHRDWVRVHHLRHRRAAQDTARRCLPIAGSGRAAQEHADEEAPHATDDVTLQYADQAEYR